MKLLRNSLLLAAIALFTISMQSCKTKKVIVKPPAPPVERPVPVEEKKVTPPPVEEKPAPVEEKPNYSFTNVQFEFDSGVLKTASFEVLDRVAKEMKKDSSVKFVLDGHSSLEGSPAHNMSLSVDRANSVKLYLVNAGVSASNLSIKGYGATQPIAPNTTEEGKALNRRVEFKIK